MFLVKREHPLTLIAIIILVSLFIGIIVRMEKRAIFGAFLILVYVGGVIIAFCYRSSLTPNPDFYGGYSNSSTFLGGALFFLLFFIFVVSIRLFWFDWRLSRRFQFNNHLGFNEG